ncbi:DEAD/DEAH box helicase [Thiomicrospira sp. XS5]|uniref:type I restriction endonuclease subunit R n=1 Tax=Thiomicrospira sp. XS5 TaxID=1775636 RepID=UPI000747CDF9|nr:HsdR family type I site-specific deoxyribonuclease [Thiomicrospira sp. XS5]KUJ74543.1 DEAD/DEAH box helicase [Thiomicrospira sp. XS5]
MTFSTEAAFEEALINTLTQKGWEDKVIKNPTEADLLQNWSDILFENNRHIDSLGDYPLTDGEMQQIIEQINELKTPLKLNGFINGKSVSIVRDNEDDALHFGKEISLSIYDRQEIAGGKSRYQIVQQPKFKASSKILNDRRGDLMLLINGMPVFHIELKKSGVPVSQAYHQIEKYSAEGIFSGLFSLVQIFVAMTPEESVYFANAGPDGKFNKDFYFNWADFNNEPIQQWDKVASSLLSIPMAHQLIGFYTVADGSDGVLKVMRSYQYYAANAISDKVSKADWEQNNIRGGFIWHTTGSGKTMTSFKAAQLIANSKDADKVVFLMDRIELGTQSYDEYSNFANDDESVQETKSTYELISKLKSSESDDTLIVTSIQKMSNIQDEEGGLNKHDLEVMNSKRVVFIVDEAHRSTFGDMMTTIKQAFPNAMFFGFTGTPINDENKKKDSMTSTVFGDELHRYTIADGIRDKNVLGFDIYKVLTYKDKEIRKAVALEQAKAKTESEAFADQKKKAIYLKFLNDVQMAGFKNDNDKYIKGIEDYIPNVQYDREEHRDQVVEDIFDNWVTLSQAGKFHAMLATRSIPEAIEYYRLIKQKMPELNITALFDPNIDNGGGVKFKQDGLVEILEDYNGLYDMDFSLATHGKFKKDISNRLSHKKPYQGISQTPKAQLDLLIVVDQMLTGFDSKWVNTLYLDKLMRYEDIIQAFSRTNRLFGPDKPFGTIRYYRYPHSMERNINDAVKSYSGDKPVMLFVEQLDKNLIKMNQAFADIAELFKNADIDDFSTLPTEKADRGQFAKLFNQLNIYLEAARVQGFVWDKLTYEFEEEEAQDKYSVSLDFDENTYLILALRYKELFSESGGGGDESIPYDINGYLTEIDTGRIDNDYMNNNFEKYLRVLDFEGATEEEIEATLNELHKSFATLTQEEQKYANIFLNDVQRGQVKLDASKTFRDYISEYQTTAKDHQVNHLCELLGLDKEKLITLMQATDFAEKPNVGGRFDALKATVDEAKAKAYFESLEGVTIPIFKLNIRIHNLLEKFVIEGGFEVDEQ